METPEIKSEIIFRYFNMNEHDITAISRKMNIAPRRVKNIINDYMKPIKKDKFIVLESKINTTFTKP